MLLLPPPVSREEWQSQGSESDVVDHRLRNYFLQYEQHVLNLPYEQLRRILTSLTDELPPGELDADDVHALLSSELFHGDDFAPCAKVARIVVLAALAETLDSLGLQLRPDTSELLELVEPAAIHHLVLAISDHYGMLAGSA